MKENVNEIAMGELHAVRNASTVRGGDAGGLSASLRRRNVVREAGGAKRGGDPRKGVWPTPDWLYRPLAALLDFDLDVAADAVNAKCRRFFTRHDDGLAQRWNCRAWWCNPPYGDDLRNPDGTGGWVFKGRAEVDRQGNRGCFLVPVKAETEWYQHGIYGLNRVVEAGRIEAGRIRGRWYRLAEPNYFVEVLELESRVPFGTKNTGWFASAVAVLNAGPRPLLPRLANVSTEVRR